MAWDLSHEQRCRLLVEAVVQGRGPARLKAWQELLRETAPHVERWARGHRLLRLLRLTSEDEPRAVLVRVVERLQRRDYENLRGFLAARSEPEPLKAQEDSIALDVLLDGPEVPGQDEVTRTPLRAWLKQLTDFAVRDHANARLGKSEALLTPSDTFAADKRKLHTDAKPFSEADGGAARPAMTDLLTLRRIAREIGEFAEQHLPDDQRRALGLRLDDASYAEIARELRLAGAPAAEQLVRAAKERLRARFRGERERFGLPELRDPREPREPTER